MGFGRGYGKASQGGIFAADRGESDRRFDGIKNECCWRCTEHTDKGKVPRYHLAQCNVRMARWIGGRTEEEGCETQNPK